MINSFALRGAGRYNNFDFMRWFFATTVLFGHSFTVIFGGDEQDLLYRLTGGRLYLGGLAVNAFFIISGYLITASWINRPEIGSFLRNRVLRIYPAYILVCLLCAFVVAPLGGAAIHSVFSKHHIVDNLARTAALSTPRTQGAFQELVYPDSLNGSLWTIRNEFLCYLLVLVLGCMKLYERGSRFIVAGLCAASLIVYAIHSHIGFEGHFNAPVFGDLNAWPRFAACYLCGMTFRLYRDRIPYSAWWAAAAALFIVVGTPLAATRAVVIPAAGTYLIFYAAFSRALPLQRFGSFGDFSYGMYLYGWPIQQLLLHYSNPHASPYALFAVAFLATSACAVLSWYYIEKPCMQRKAKTNTVAPKPTIVAEPRLPFVRRSAPLNVQFVFKDSNEPLTPTE